MSYVLKFREPSIPDTKKKCRIIAGYRIKPPRIEGDRWTVQQRGRNNRWETAITSATENFALEWVKSRSPNIPC